MAESSAKDLTVGAPMSVIMRYALPVIAGMLFQQLYVVVDLAIVGQMVGVNALAGVGETSCLNYVIVGFCEGICAGFTIPVAQSFGAGNRTKMRRLSANCLYLSIAFALIITTVFFSLCGTMLTWMKAPADIYEYSFTYFRIILLGIPVVYFYNVLAGLIRALGDSRHPLYYLVTSCVLNIILDVIFIGPLNMGIRGAAVATVLSQAISGTLCLIHIIRRLPELHLSGEDWKIDITLWKELVSMGIPMGLQNSITAFGTVILQYGVNTLGADGIAAVAAGGKINYLFAVFYEGIGTAIATYTGQNVGARKAERLDQGLKAGTIIGTVYTAAAVVTVFLGGGLFARLFLGEAGAGLVLMVRHYLVINGIFLYPALFLNLLRYMIQGMGYPNVSLLAGLAELVSRILIVVTFIPLWGFEGACYSNALSWTTAMLILIIPFILIRKKTFRSFERQ